MILKVVDGTPLEKLSLGSHKKIIFKCDICSKDVEQSYRNYNKQKDGKFCRSCRNIYTANRDDVKQKHSDNGKKMWSNPEYRKMMVDSGKLSKAIQDSWDNGREYHRKFLQENNPMFREEVRLKVSESETTSELELKNIAEEYGYEYLGRIMRQRGGVKLKLKCPFGHIITKGLGHFRSGNAGCGECCKKFSQAEKDISIYIKSLDLDIIENNRTIISPQELDIVIPEKMIAIEYCGLYWHGETKGKYKNYHLDKLKRCNEQGYRLITIFEDEWINKQEITKTRLKHILGCSDNKLYARKCAIKEISPKIANEFVNKYHIQGSTGSSIKLGMYNNGDLVSVMTFAKPSLSKGRKSFDNVYELSRFCSSVHVVGGASKLLSHFKKNYEWNEIFTFADLRWSEGIVYDKSGFDLDGTTKPNYWYFNQNKIGMVRKHRFNYRKDMLDKLFDDVDMTQTEWQIMQSQGFDRIWDCGNFKFKITNIT